MTVGVMLKSKPGIAYYSVVGPELNLGRYPHSTITTSGQIYVADVVKLMMYIA